MKSIFLLATAAAALFCATSCNRQDASSDPNNGASQTYVPNPSVTHSSARIVTSAYSQPISIDTANKMIGSYLQSINYPYQDTTMRTFAFDADTLRAYLQNTSITAVKFYLAHQLSYLDADPSRYGKNIGMRPGALTIICVGVDDYGNVVRNSSNGVYEHAMPCPNYCDLAIDAYLH